VLRVDDLDRPRVVAGSEHQVAEALAWLGLSFHEGPSEGGHDGPYRQSERIPRYEAALAALEARGLTYLCDCSRAEIARTASAPHAGEEGPRYPGTCRPRGMARRTFRRPPAVRLATPSIRATYVDGRRGRVPSDVHAEAGDIVLRRGDGVFAYQLACAVDDHAMRISEVVRGADLASSAPLQALIIELLGGTPPTYTHVPLLVGSDGARLAKRHGGATVDELREAGADPDDVVRALAAAYGHAIGDGSAPLEGLATLWDPARLPQGPVSIDDVLGRLA
jgi:glutamyl-tRNA synthetase